MLILLYKMPSGGKYLTDNPNAPDNNGETPIYLAAANGYTEMVRISAPLTNNHNAPGYYDGKTPTELAKNEEIRRILESFNTSTKQK